MFLFECSLISVTRWVTNTGKRLLSFLMYFKTVFEFVQKKIRFTFGSVSSVKLFLIQTAVTAAYNLSFRIMFSCSKMPVYFFLLQMIHSLNFRLLHFKNKLHTQGRGLKNQKTNLTLLYLLVS